MVPVWPSRTIACALEESHFSWGPKLLNHLRGKEVGVSTPAHSPSVSRRQSIEAALKRLLKQPPKLHCPKDSDPAHDPANEEELVSWGIHESFLKLLVEMVSPDSLTLETGSGLSTVCLAIIGSEHICMSPSQQEHDRIRHYCRKHQISTERIRFLPMKSHAVLPSLDIGGRKLDFALIDGAHAFPEPILDYYYVNKHLKIGGLLAIDDLDISCIGILHKFLITEPAYEPVKIDWWYGLKRASTGRLVTLTTLLIGSVRGLIAGIPICHIFLFRQESGRDFDLLR